MQAGRLSEPQNAGSVLREGGAEPALP